MIDEGFLLEHLGGIYSPTDCQSRQELAIIIPFRNREHPLKILLRHLHPFLQRQKRAYRIIVVEQVDISRSNSSRSSHRILVW